jgi:hypothetical protein
MAVPLPAPLPPPAMAPPAAPTPAPMAPPITAFSRTSPVLSRVQDSEEAQRYHPCMFLKRFAPVSFSAPSSCGERESQSCVPITPVASQDIGHQLLV